MKKKVLGVLLAATMAVGMLAGCGGGGAAEEAPATDDAAATEEAAPAEEATETDDSAGSTGDAITIGFAQVGHESDWRTASTKSCQDVFSADNGYDLSFVDCDNVFTISDEDFSKYVTDGKVEFAGIISGSDYQHIVNGILASEMVEESTKKLFK